MKYHLVVPRTLQLAIVRPGHLFHLSPNKEGLRPRVVAALILLLWKLRLPRALRVSKKVC